VRATYAGPSFTADGRRLYYREMRRAGFEAGRCGQMAMDLRSGKVREIAADWDRSADGIVLSADGRTLYTSAQHVGQHPLFAVDLASGKVEQVTGEGSIGGFDIAGDTLAYLHNSLETGNQLFTASLSNPSAARAITPSASEMLPEGSVGQDGQVTVGGRTSEP